MAKRVVVEVRNGDLNKALKRFKKKVIQSGHIQELKDRKEYVKPKTERRVAKQAAIRKEYRKNMTELWESGNLKHNPFVKKTKKSSRPIQKSEDNENKS